MVLPVDSRDFLYSIPEKVADEEDPIDMIWEDDAIGIVLDIQSLVPEREYCQVQVIVGDVVGWTYSDYIRAIRR